MEDDGLKSCLFSMLSPCTTYGCELLFYIHLFVWENCLLFQDNSLWCSRLVSCLDYEFKIKVGPLELKLLRNVKTIFPSFTYFFLNSLLMFLWLASASTQSFSGLITHSSSEGKLFDGTKRFCSEAVGFLRWACDVSFSYSLCYPERVASVGSLILRRVFWSGFVTASLS